MTSKAVVAKAGIKPEDVKGIVFSTQAQGVIPVDEQGNNLMNNITWVDGRAEEQAQKIMNRLGGTKVFTMLVGTPIMGKGLRGENGVGEGQTPRRVCQDEVFPRRQRLAQVQMHRRDCTPSFPARRLTVWILRKNRG